MAGTTSCPRLMLHAVHRTTPHPHSTGPILSSALTCVGKQPFSPKLSQGKNPWRNMTLPHLLAFPFLARIGRVVLTRSRAHIFQGVLGRLSLISDQPCLCMILESCINVLLAHSAKRGNANVKATPACAPTSRGSSYSKERVIQHRSSAAEFQSSRIQRLQTYSQVSSPLNMMSTEPVP